MNQTTAVDRSKIKTVAQIAEANALMLAQTAERAEQQVEAQIKKRADEKLSAERERVRLEAEATRRLKNERRRARKGIMSLLELCADEDIQRIVKVYGELHFFNSEHSEVVDSDIDGSWEVDIFFQEDKLCIKTLLPCYDDKSDTITIPVTGDSVNWEVYLPLNDFEQRTHKVRKLKKFYNLSITNFLLIISTNDNLDYYSSELDVESSEKFLEAGWNLVHGFIFQALISFSQKKMLNKALVELLNIVSKETASK